MCGLGTLDEIAVDTGEPYQLVYKKIGNLMQDIMHMHIVNKKLFKQDNEYISKIV